MSKWIWNYGDFELYHSLKLHSRRQERGYKIPVTWQLSGFDTNVRFRKKINIEKEETFVVIGNGTGYVDVGYKKHEFNKPITLSAGEYMLEVHVGNLYGIPAVFIEGDGVTSDETWIADCYNDRWKNVGTNYLYTDKTVTPDIFKFSYKKLEPEVSVTGGGVLYDCKKETFAVVEVLGAAKPLTLYFGESKQEATDSDNCYLYENVSEKCVLPSKGFRYIYIPDAAPDDIELEINYEYLPVERRASFSCSDEMLNKIWEVSAHTLELNSREFYLDGIKRDRWVWSGDAYQSYFLNRYLCFDEDIVRRTIIALGGKGVIYKHINIILDYTFYWLISIYDYYEMTGDIKFVEDIFPRMKEFMDFCLSRLDSNGLAARVGYDWIFIDWAEIDKTGAVCAEQFLLWRSTDAFIKCAELLNIDCEKYKSVRNGLADKINKFYWNEEKGAFIDSFESGKNNVTRHANIFALLFGYASEEQKEAIIKNVILNNSVTQIKTPYFKFYELEALCRIGRTDDVMKKIKSYWGGMVEAGATSFWEEFEEGTPGEKQLGMYGMKYGKSLCHAWGASPVYLIGRYFLGVYAASPAYKSFEVKPALNGIETVDAVVPIKDGAVHIKKNSGILEVCATRDGGSLIYDSKEYKLNKNEAVKINLN